MDTITNKTRLGYRFPVRATTITPVHVGGNELLSVISDYYISNKRVYRLDGDKLAKLLLDRNQTEAFVAMVNKAASENNEKTKGELLPQFFKNVLGTDLADSSLASYPAFVKGNATDIQECIKTDDYPYLPGSSVKGAIRTAILFAWLSDKNNNKSQQALSQWTSVIKDIYDSSSKPGKKEIAQIDKEFDRLIEEGLFGRLADKQQRLAMSLFKISDSILFSPECLSIHELVRFNFSKGVSDIPVLKECIGKQAGCTFEIRLDFDKLSQNKNEMYPDILRLYTDPKKLCSTINAYSRAVLEYEIGVIENNEYSPHLKEYRNWLDELLLEIDNAGSQTAYLRIGAGKMQFYQTIAAALFDYFGKNENDDNWIYYLSYCDSFNAKGVTSPYPITRVLTSIGQMPLGWIKIDLSP